MFEHVYLPEMQPRHHVHLLARLVPLLSGSNACNQRKHHMAPQVTFSTSIRHPWMQSRTGIKLWQAASSLSAVARTRSTGKIQHLGAQQASDFAFRSGVPIEAAFLKDQVNHKFGAMTILLYRPKPSSGAFSP